MEIVEKLNGKGQEVFAFKVPGKQGFSVKKSLVKVYISQSREPDTVDAITYIKKYGTLNQKKILKDISSA